MASQLIYHGRRASKLPVGYDCNWCRMPEKNLPKGCPTCPLTHSFERMFDNSWKHIWEQMQENWTREELTRMVSAVSSTKKVLADNENKIDIDWDAEFCEMARVCISEQNRAEMLDRPIVTSE